MKKLLVTLFITVCAVQGGFSQEQKDANTKGSSRRPTVNQSQQKQSVKEKIEIDLNKNRTGAPQNNTSDSIRNTRPQPGENAALKNETNPEGVSKKSPEKTNAVSIFETGTSPAGSPSVKSNENGEHRDGTNTVQRAGYNRAGSPVKGPN